jgi:multiple sugar transport system permease protein
MATTHVTTRKASAPARESKGRRKWPKYVLLTALAVFFLFPVMFMLVGAFKPDGKVLSEANSLKAFVPTGFTFENFGDAFDRAEFGKLFINSTIIAVFVVGLGLIVNSLVGYSIARLPFPGARLVLLGIIALTIIPLEAVAIPLLFMVSELEWRNTYHVQILPFVANPLFMFLFYTFFLGIPKELEEAARIDGAGPVTTFVRVVAPLARPVYATVGILSFLFIWGQLLWPVLVTAGTDVRPLPQGISIFTAQPPISWGDIMAFALMMTLPLLIIFIVFQRWFVQSVARSGLKG